MDINGRNCMELDFQQCPTERLNPTDSWQTFFYEKVGITDTLNTRRDKQPALCPIGICG